MDRAQIQNKILSDLQKNWDMDDVARAMGATYDGIPELEDYQNELDEKAFADDKRDEYNALSKDKRDERDRESARLSRARGLVKEQTDRRKAEFDNLSDLQKFGTGFNEAFGEGKADHQKAYWNARQARDLDIEAPRLEQMFGTNPSITRARDLIAETEFLPAGIRNMFGSNEGDRASRKAAGLGLAEPGMARTGQLVGTALSDINQDRFRSLWWLINAPQAVTNLLQETSLSHMAPDLYSSDKVVDADGYEITLEDDNYEKLMSKDIDAISLDRQGKPVLRQGVTRVSASDAKNQGKIALSRRRYRPGMVDALQIPSALAMNAGVGLLNPFGGSNGYGAVFESEDDPTKTNNVIGEVAAKYILGRTGNMLPWDEFKKVRPDVSKDEYMRYKAFKYDKKGDFNPLDGDFTLPTGVLKGTSEGIHGPEIQFLGRSMPLLTTMLPTLAAGLGTSIGASRQPAEFNSWDQERKDLHKMRDDRIKQIKQNNKSPEIIEDKINKSTDELKEAKRKIWRSKGEDAHKRYRSINRVKHGIIGGLTGYATGLGTGLLLENERRRRNQNENESQQQQL